MALSLDIPETEGGWTSAAEGVLEPAVLGDWIGKYFYVCEDLLDFSRRNSGVLEVTAKDLSRGYVFSYIQPGNSNPESRMFSEKLVCESGGKKIVRYFGDPFENLFGFSWEL